MSRIHILKFGGTSLQNSTFIKQAVEIVQKRAGDVRPVVVVSAISGVTDRLIALTDIPFSDAAEAKQLISELRNQHSNLITQLGGISTEYYAKLESLFDELEEVFFDVNRRSGNPKAWRDHILSIGERASARVFASALSAKRLPSVPVEAQHYIKTDATFGEANILPGISRKLIFEALHSMQEIAVITGFIGSTRQQEITTLGRSGSDYTAGIIADALKADHLEIWTDVNGVLTADPKIVPGARNIEYLSFEDISELSAHGANVIHPKTMQPIKDSDISVLVRNSYQPKNPGTLIQRNHRSNGDFRSITVTGPFVYFEVPDQYAHQLNRLIEEKPGAGSDAEGFGYSRTSRFEPAQFVIKESVFKIIENEIKKWAAQENLSLEVSENLFRVNTFTNNLYQNDEPVAHILRLLKNKDIRPVRIHREHKRRYLSLLFPEEEASRAAQLINDYLITGSKRIHIFLAGIGAVGGMLLQQIDEFHSNDFELKVTGLCDSRKTLWESQGLHVDNLNEELSEGEPTHWPTIVQKLTESDRRRTIFVDATGSEEVARHYPELLEAGIHIATPSKLANTFEQAYYDLLRKKASQKKASFRYETTVGAGLPVISTINDLLQSGDTITELSGVVSGTMTYLFTELENGTSFSEAVIKARELGYAEPDPRDDLSGEDVARKFLTLVREIGIRIERDELEVESLIPDELKEVDRETFLNRLDEFDAYWEKKIDHARSKEETLRYTGKFKDGKIKIGVQRLPKNSSLGQLRGTDNLLRIYSLRYSQTPIIIQGPGAGREVTAAGVLTDILKIAGQLT